MKTFTFKISHDNGSFKLTTYANTLEAAQKMVTKAENCPISALKLVSEHETMYKVIKMFRVSQRRQVLARYLTEEEAKRMVNSYPDSNSHMVMFMKQFNS